MTRKKRFILFFSQTSKKKRKQYIKKIKQTHVIHLKSSTIDNNTAKNENQGKNRIMKRKKTREREGGRTTPKLIIYQIQDIYVFFSIGFFCLMYKVTLYTREWYHEGQENVYRYTRREREYK